MDMDARQLVKGRVAEADADLGIDRGTIEKYEPLVEKMFEAVRNADRRPEAKSPGRVPPAADGARAVKSA